MSLYSTCYNSLQKLFITAEQYDGEEYVSLTSKYEISILHFAHHELELTIFILQFLTLRQNCRLLLQLQVVVVHFCQRVSFIRTMRYDIFMDSLRHASLHLKGLSVYRLLGLGTRGNSKLQSRIQQRFSVKFTVSVSSILVNRVFKLGLTVSEHALFIFFKDLIPLLLHFFDPLEFRFCGSFFDSPLLLQSLKASDLNFMQVIFLPEDIELFLHTDDKLVFQFIKLNLKLSSLLFMFMPQCLPHLVSVFFHESVDPGLLGNFELAEFFSEVKSFVHPFLEGDQFLLKLQFLEPVFWFDLQVLVGVGQPILQLLCLVKGLLLKILSPLNLGSLELLELAIKLIAKLINSILAFLLVRLQLSLVNSFPKVSLPLSDVRLQTSHLMHQSFELYIQLQVKAVIGNKFQSFLYEGKYANLLIGTQHPILVLIEDTHEFLNGANLGEAVEVGLKLPEDQLEHLLGEVGSCHLILGKTSPDCLTLGSAF